MMHCFTVLTDCVDVKGGNSKDGWEVAYDVFASENNVCLTMKDRMQKVMTAEEEEPGM